MQLTGSITPESLMGLEAYSKYRKAHKAELTHDNVDRYVIGACAEAHGDLVELTWGLQTPIASRILLTATVDALDAARKVLAN